MDPLMQLVVGWALVGGFVITLALTCASLVGWVEFVDPAQQKLLFKVLLVELVVGVGGKVTGAWRFDARAVGADVYAEGTLDGGAAVGEAWIASQATPEAVESSRAAVVGAVERLSLPAASSAQIKRVELLEDLRVAPDREALSRTLRDAQSIRRIPR